MSLVCRPLFWTLRPQFGGEGDKKCVPGGRDHWMCVPPDTSGVEESSGKIYVSRRPNKDKNKNIQLV